MTRTFKEVTLKVIRDLQNDLPADGVIQMSKFTTELQSRIIVSCALGQGSSEWTINYENDDGSVS